MQLLITALVTGEKTQHEQLHQHCPGINHPWPLSPRGVHAPVWITRGRHLLMNFWMLILSTHFGWIASFRRTPSATCLISSLSLLMSAHEHLPACVSLQRCWMLLWLAHHRMLKLVSVLSGSHCNLHRHPAASVPATYVSYASPNCSII